MPITYEINERQHCIFVTLAGYLTEWDLGVGLQALWDDPKFTPAFDRLVDATGIDALVTRPLFIQAAAQDVRQISGTNPAGRVALIATSDPVRYLLDVYKEGLRGIQCQLFRDKKEASDWLLHR
jgi:hypothetical protein